MEAPSPTAIIIIICVLIGVFVISVMFCLIGWGLHKAINEYGKMSIEGDVFATGLYTTDNRKLSCYPDKTLTPSNTYVAYYLVSKQVGDIDFYNASPAKIVSITLFDNTTRFVGAEISVPVQSNKEPELSINLWKFITTKDQKAPKVFADAPWTKVGNVKNVSTDPSIKSIILTDHTVSVLSNKNTTIQKSKYNLGIPCSLTGVNSELKAYDSEDTEFW